MAGAMGAGSGLQWHEFGWGRKPRVSLQHGWEAYPSRALKAGSGRFRAEMSSQSREQWRQRWGVGMASSQQLPADLHHL